MDTPQPIPQPTIGQAPTVSPQAEALPWLSDEVVVAAPSVSAVCRTSAAAAKPQHPAEAVHWSIVLLTLATAASVLFGSYAGVVSRPKELLPVMIVAPAR
jgi:hypothetical protein